MEYKTEVTTEVGITDSANLTDVEHKKLVDIWCKAIKYKRPENVIIDDIMIRGHIAGNSPKRFRVSMSDRVIK